MLEIQRGNTYQPGSPSYTLSVRCPGCKKQGTFEALSNVNDVHLPDGILLGQRRCPDPECRGHLFFIRKGQTVICYPPERLDFDSTNVPTRVASALAEAITCHAGECYTAAAIMVRKTLEELCGDRGATGANLKDRLRALGTKVILPADLLDGLDDLRLLGNDAAHIESREFDEIGKEEVEVGVELAKEVLKAVYQYSALLARLRGLKKTP